MAVKLTGGHLIKLLQHLKSYDPYSAVMSGVIKSVTKGDPHGMQVWANRETEPNVVVVSADESKCKNSYCQKIVFVYSTDNNEIDIKDTLQSPGVLNLKSKIHFRDVLKSTHNVIQSVMLPKEGKVTSIIDNLIILEGMPSSILSPCPLPRGFHFGTFTPEIADLAEKKWVVKGPEVSDYFSNLNQWGYEPTVVYKNNDNTPVAWVLQDFYEMHISFYVKPEYRGTRIGLSLGLEHTCRQLQNKRRALSMASRKNKVILAGLAKKLRIKQHEEAEFVYNVFDFSN